MQTAAVCLLLGCKITAENVDDTVKLYAEKDDQRYTATLNAEGKFEFSEAGETVSESIVENTWIDVEGATEPSYTFTVAEEDYYAQYRLKVTILDEEYLSQCIDILEGQGAELTEEQKAEQQSLYSVVMQIESSEKKEEASSPVQTENGLETMMSLFAVNTQPYLSEDGQWICGLNNNYEYITEDTYNRVTQWKNEGKITSTQYSYYWTWLNPKGWKGSPPPHYRPRASASAPYRVPGGWLLYPLFFPCRVRLRRTRTAHLFGVPDFDFQLILVHIRFSLCDSFLFIGAF